MPSKSTKRNSDGALDANVARHRLQLEVDRSAIAGIRWWRRPWKRRPPAEGRDLGFDTYARGQPHADIAGYGSHRDVRSTAATDADVAAGRSDRHVTVANVDPEITRCDRRIESAPYASKCAIARDRRHGCLAVDIATRELTGCRSEVESCGIAHLDVATCRMQADDAQPADQAHIAGCRAELDIGA